MEKILWLRTICQKNGVRLDEKQAELLDGYVRLLLRCNKDLNLISRRDEDRVWENHILHSISILFKCSFQNGMKILDLGTGGGLPGIPLRIVLPSFTFTLLDSIQKKVKAVQQILTDLGLTDVQVLCSRAEDLASQSQCKQQFDVVISRAVAPLKKLVTWSIPLLKPGLQPEQHHRTTKPQIFSGTLVAYKGGDVEREISEVKASKAAKSIDEIPLVFHGSEQASFVEKKVILVRL